MVVVLAVAAAAANALHRSVDSVLAVQSEKRNGVALVQIVVVVSEAVSLDSAVVSVLAVDRGSRDAEQPVVLNFLVASESMSQMLSQFQMSHLLQVLSMIRK